ncbi:MAG: bifunctional diaminohydroxyphosphoribosylaminopyrimidine deaminase/5-amino-6-(5-phosphoribosylamino)uracil reductase RibD [Candidatus Polarisedimenticolia bacterium]
MRDGDERLLGRAIELAARAGRGAAPNPRVGAVVVGAGGAIVGEGWHRRAGEAHAETQALAAAGEAARGATLYLSLEPCVHTGRTPPCARAIIAAQVRRVVVAMIDPDERVAGRGVEELRAAGIEVELAGAETERAAERLNEDYLLHRRRGRAFAALKVAATLDGRIADASGASQWITGAEARRRAKELRGLYGAVVVGAGTLLADDPGLLPPDGPAGAPPFLRCIVDGALRARPEARLFRVAAEAGIDSPIVIYCRPDADPARRAALEREGAEVVPLGAAGAPIPPAEILRDLARRGVLGAYVEGGGRTLGAFLAAGCADKFYWFSAPRLLGDAGGAAALDAGPRPLAAAFDWRVEVEERLGEDRLFVLYPRASGAERV